MLRRAKPRVIGDAGFTCRSTARQVLLTVARRRRTQNFIHTKGREYPDQNIPRPIVDKTGTPTQTTALPSTTSNGLSLKNLNAAQLAAAQHTDGPNRVIARMVEVPSIS